MKVFTACISHESNSFSPIATNLGNFEEALLHLPFSAKNRRAVSFIENNLAFHSMSVERGYTHVQSTIATAEPSAPMQHSDYCEVKNETIQHLKQSLPVNMVFLFLHGAQMTDKIDDCEGDLISSIRDVVGSDVPIGVELDLHANASEEMIDHANVILCCREYPHTDFYETSQELFRAIDAMATQGLSAKTLLVPIPMVGIFGTRSEAMQEVNRRVNELVNLENVVCASLSHGFPWSDTANAHANIIVSYHYITSELNDALSVLSRFIFGERENVEAKHRSIDDVMNLIKAPMVLPTIIAETSDNSGGGAGSDSTHLLQALLENKFKKVVVALFWDPECVAITFASETGTLIDVNLGGKSSPLSGEPIKGKARLIGKLSEGHQSGLAGEDNLQSLGRCVAIDMNGITIIVTSIRQQPYNTEFFDDLGIDIQEMDLIVLKSAQHFRAGYDGISNNIIYCDATGVTTRQYETLPYVNILRPLWPLDQPPFNAYGEAWS